MSFGRAQVTPSPEERRRREEQACRRRCSTLQKELSKLNKALFADQRVDANDHEGNNLERLQRQETELEAAVEKARKALERRHALEAQCSLTESQLRQVVEDFRNPHDFEPQEPEISSFKDLQAWKGKLDQMLNVALIRRDREALALSKDAARKLDLTNVDLSRKRDSRIDKIRIARRMDKLAKLAEGIANIEDDQVRESFTLEARDLLDKENDDEFDEAVIGINTRAREARRKERFRNQAIREAGRVSHLDPDDAAALMALAQQAQDQDDVAHVRREADALITAWERKEEERYVRQALQEVLVEMGYDVGEGFQQADFGAIAFAKRPDLPDYAMRIQFNGDDAKLFTRIVSQGQTDATQDVQAERKMCPDTQSLADGLREKGIDATIERQTKPGDHPMDKTAQARNLHAGHAQRARRANAAAKRRNA